MNALSEYFAMGGYAAYVWPSFAIVAAVLIGLLVMSLRQMRAAERALAELEARRA